MKTIKAQETESQYLRDFHFFFREIIQKFLSGLILFFWLRNFFMIIFFSAWFKFFIVLLFQVKLTQSPFLKV